MSPKRPLKVYFAEVALIFIGMVWGATFPVVKIAIETTGPLWFNALRFLLAAVIAAGILIFRRKGLSKEIALYGLLLGTLLAVAYTT